MAFTRHSISFLSLSWRGFERTLSWAAFTTHALQSIQTLEAEKSKKLYCTRAFERSWIHNQSVRLRGNHCVSEHGSGRDDLHMRVPVGARTTRELVLHQGPMGTGYLPAPFC